MRTAPQVRTTHNLTMVIPSHFVHLDLPFLRKSNGRYLHDGGAAGVRPAAFATPRARTPASWSASSPTTRWTGVILSRTLQDDPCIELLRQFRVPFVAIGRTEDPSIPQVDNDHGQRQPGDDPAAAFSWACAGSPCSPAARCTMSTRDRAKGYMDAMAQWGVQPDPGLIHTGIETDVQRIDALEAVLERRPDCILCGDDRLAFDVSLELQARQIRVPDQMRVASLYDSELTAWAQPRHFGCTV